MSTSNSSSRRAASLRWLAGFYLPVAIIAAASCLAVYRYSERITETLKLDQQTLAVAGRIGALGEQVGKSILLIEKGVRDGKPISSSVYELQISADRLDQVVNAFNEGSEVVAPDGVRFMLEAVTDEQALTSLQEMNTVWFGMKSRADSIVLSAGPKKAVTEAKSFNDAMLSESADFVLAQQSRLAEQNLVFTRRLQALATARVSSLETPRNILIGVAAIALLALPGVWLLNRARRVRDEASALAAELGANKTVLEAQSLALANAKHETDRIMETVQEGLLLVDREGVIGAQYSHELAAIFRQENLGGANLLHLLQRLLSEKMFNTTKDYLALLFDARRREKAVIQVNPLDSIEVSFPNPEGGFIHRHLGFSFRRIMEGADVARVFVAVRDITTQVDLEKRLRESEKVKERQLEILLGIVHASPDDLATFAELVERELDSINTVLRAEDFAPSASRQQGLHERLTAVFRSIHNIKGNAVYLHLEHFQKSAESFENKISELLQRPALGGDDFLAIVVAQAGMRADLGDLVELRGKLLSLRGVVPASASAAGDSTTPTSPVETLAARLTQLAHEIAASLGKEIDFQIDAYALHAFAAFRHDLVRDVLIQVIRNALAHGVELPDEREAAGKPRAARLTVRALPRTEDGLIGLALRDDGHGLNLERIRVRAESLGLVPAGTAASPADLARCIFTPGFSTAAQVDIHAGRGAGLDILKTRIVDEIGGAIEVSTEPGRFCEFALYLPEIPDPAQL